MVTTSVTIIRLERSAAAPRESEDRSTARTNVAWKPTRGETIYMVVFVGYGVARVALGSRGDVRKRASGRLDVRLLEAS
jgi:hypothetical protein